MNATDASCECHWNPMNILCPDSANFKYVVMILNQPIKGDRDAMLSLWQNAYLKITVDGGTNHWFNFSEGEKCSLPDFVTGDLDSVEESILHYYKNKGVRIVVTPDQNMTDFTKAAFYVAEHLSRTNTKVDAIVAVVQSAGRMDQIFANINTLFKVSYLKIHTPVYLLSSDSLSWLLTPGFHEIKVPSDLIMKQVWCGLVPVGSRANSVTTTGLKWNLSDQPLEFGHCVSTSNYCSGESAVTIKTDSTLLWTMGLRESDDFS